MSSANQTPSTVLQDVPTDEVGNLVQNAIDTIAIHTVKIECKKNDDETWTISAYTG